MATDDKIHYSDLVQKDDSIQQLIQALTDLNSTYGTTLETIKQGADKIVASLSKASGATKQGRTEIEQTSAMATKLERVYASLENTLGRIERRLSQVGAQISKTSNTTKAQARATAGYLTSLNKDLKAAKDMYAQLFNEGKTAEAQAQLELIAGLDDKIKKINENIGIATGRIKQNTAATQEDIEAQKKKKSVLNDAEKLEQKRAKVTGEVAEKTVLLKQEITEMAAETKKAAITTHYGANSYLGLQARIQSLILQYQALDQTTDSNRAKATELATEIRTLRAQIGIMEEQIGSSNLGNYGSSFNRLGYSVQQVVRELPSAAIGFQTFFLAISNNIPIVIDEVNRLREANKANAAINKDLVIPVGKQIIKALLNWQTLLIGAITVLSMYGNEIFEWAKAVFTGRDAALSYSDAMEKVRKSFKEDASQAAKNIVLYEALRRQWSELSTEADKTSWLEKNVSLTGELGVELENVNKANKFFLDNAENIRQAYIKQAMAEAAMALAAKQAEKAIKDQMRIRELEQRQNSGKPTFWQKARASMANAGGSRVYVTAEDILASDLERVQGRAQKSADKLNPIIDVYNDLQKQINDLFGEFAKGLDNTNTKTEREGRDLEERLNNLYLKAKKNYEEDLTSLERNEAEKRRKQAQDDYAQRIRDIENDIRKANAMLNNEEDKYKDLTDDQRQLLVEIIKTLEQSKITAMSVLTRALFDADRVEAEAWADFFEHRNELNMELATEGSEEYLNLQLKALDLELAAMWRANAEKEEIYRVDEKIFKDIYDKRRKLLLGTYELEQFERQQGIDAVRFNTGRPSQTASIQFDLQQQIDLLNKQKELAEQGKLQWTPKDFALANAQLAKLNKELEASKDIINRIGELGITGTILDSLGFDAEAIGAFEDAVNTVISNLQEIAQAEIEAAQAAVDAAEERVNAVQSAYDAEIEARNNGYANSVATAKAELQEEKKKQKEKEKILADAQRRQERLNSLTQTSSLITASANLWSSFSGSGPIGVALALAAISTMWGSFATAKAKAKQVTSQEYGEGGLEFLEGGSHASGNDIDLGTTNSRGLNMRAEGGEAMAIINRRNTRRYRRMLPGIVEALNNGTFEDKYLKAFAPGDTLRAQINDRIVNLDLSKLESDVSQIKHQNSTKYCDLGNNAVLVIKGNVKRYVKKC